MYHPLTGLHDPIVVDPRYPNFEGLGVTVRCLPRDDLNDRAKASEEASTLCDRVSQLFETQGAVVTVSDVVDIDDFDEEEEEEEEEAPLDADLVMEIRSRLVHKRQPFFTIPFFLASFTVLPVVEERTFAIDVAVRDGNGFLLLQDSYQGRVVSRGGIGPWLFNKLGDLGRAKEDRLTVAASRRRFSEDLYRQLSQQLFDAMLRWRVVREGNRPAPSAVLSPVQTTGETP
ncbi:MAG: hypothetical protein AAGA48_22290 [Myxococcota bacterium]